MVCFVSLTLDPQLRLPQCICRCDERFVGYGGNKAACLFEMYLSGISFYVLSDHFLVHQNHLYEEAARKHEVSFSFLRMWMNAYLNPNSANTTVRSIQISKRKLVFGGLWLFLRQIALIIGKATSNDITKTGRSIVRQVTMSKTSVRKSKEYLGSRHRCVINTMVFSQLFNHLSLLKDCYDVCIITRSAMTCMTARLQPYNAPKSPTIDYSTVTNLPYENNIACPLYVSIPSARHDHPDLTINTVPICLVCAILVPTHLISGIKSPPFPFVRKSLKFVRALISIFFCES